MSFLWHDLHHSGSSEDPHQVPPLWWATVSMWLLWQKVDVNNSYSRPQLYFGGCLPFIETGVPYCHFVTVCCLLFLCAFKNLWVCLPYWKRIYSWHGLICFNNMYVTKYLQLLTRFALTLLSDTIISFLKSDLRTSGISKNTLRFTMRAPCTTVLWRVVIILVTHFKPWTTTSRESTRFVCTKCYST